MLSYWIKHWFALLFIFFIQYPKNDHKYMDGNLVTWPVFTPVFSTDHLRLHHLAQMLIPGVQGAYYTEVI